jgi:putative ABC transport system permease protein
VRVLGFAAVAVTIAAGILFGLAPAMLRSPTDGHRQRTLRDGRPRGAPSGPALAAGCSSFLVATEVALSCALLVGAGLLIRSLAALQRVDTGVRAEGTLVVPYVPPLFAFDSVPQLTALYRSIEERVGAIPGVQHAGIIDILPMSGSFNGNTFTIAGRPEPAAGERWSAETRAASANALEALGIEIGRGRSITTADRQDAARVAIINETLARRWWPDADPIGAQINVLGELREIVGIAADVREFTPDRAPDPGIWVPHEQAPDWIRTQRTHVIVHTTGDPFERAAAVRQTLRDIEPRAAIGTPNAMRNVVAATVAAPRFRTTLLIAFAGVALLLAIVGIYGVVSRAVAQRRHEMGIRLSLGASGADVLGILVRDGMLPVLGGIVAGVLGAFALARVLEGLLFGVAAADPLTFVVAPLALALTALLACLLPAPPRDTRRSRPRVALGLRRRLLASAALPRPRIGNNAGVIPSAASADHESCVGPRCRLNRLRRLNKPRGPMAPGAVLGELEYLVMLAVLQLEGGAGAVEIRELLRARAGRAVSRGTVYTTLDRLVRKGFADWLTEDATPEQGGIPRRLFRVTKAGQAEVSRSARAIAQLSEGLSLT